MEENEEHFRHKILLFSESKKENTPYKVGPVDVSSDHK